MKNGKVGKFENKKSYPRRVLHRREVFKIDRVWWRNFSTEYHFWVDFVHFWWVSCFITKIWLVPETNKRSQVTIRGTLCTWGIGCSRFPLWSLPILYQMKKTRTSKKGFYLSRAKCSKFASRCIVVVAPLSKVTCLLFTFNSFAEDFLSIKNTSNWHEKKLRRIREMCVNRNCSGDGVRVRFNPTNPTPVFPFCTPLTNFKRCYKKVDRKK